MIEAQAQSSGWSAGGSSLVLLYTAPSLTICIQSGCTASNEPCGFHSISSGNLAFGVVVMSGAYAACGGGSPDGNYAIQLTGHEQNEAIVDPAGTGTEVADPCQGHFALNTINGESFDLPELLLAGNCASEA